MHDYVSGIDHAYFLKKNQKSFNRRKLLLQVGSPRIFFCVNASEFMEFKSLLSMNSNPTLIETSSFLEEGFVYN